MSSGASQSGQRAPAPGTVLCGKYRVERELGSGGMGTVVLARHLKLDRLVAIKLLPASRPGDPYLSARVLREARAMARLASEHVVRVLDLDELPGGAPVLVMELLEGVDLERRLAEGPVEAPRAVDWALQACAALAEAHARGIVHRDVKPANLFLSRQVGGAELVKLLDFGISKVAGEDLRLTHTAMGLGSPLFMSPEQLLAPSQVDRRTDVWSLGVTLFRLLSGRAPYDARELSTLSAQIAARPPASLLELAPGLDPALAAVVMRCLEKSVDARWPDVVTLAAALQPFRAPGGLGDVAAVRRAEAQGLAAAAAVESVELASSVPAGARTLSHDVPRVDALAAPGPASTPPPSEVSAGGASLEGLVTPSPSRRGWRLGVALAVVLGLGVAGAWWARPGGAVTPPAAAPPNVPTAIATRPEPEPPPVVVPPAVVAPKLVPAGRSDGGAPRAARPGVGSPRDPADLEIKE